MTIQKVAIIGLGLIGGSIGMSLCRSELIPTVTGWDPSAKTRQEALNRQAIHYIPASLQESVLDADLVILATPIRQVSVVLKKILPSLKKDAILTDVASVKGEIAREVKSMLPKGLRFVGGHPMAGTEGQGIGAADPFLFENAVYILTPTESSDEEALFTLSGILGILGAHPLLLSPEQHDRMVASVSHLPHIAAASVANVAGELEKVIPGTLSLAAGSFRDTTRVALSPPELWREVVFSNRQFILEMLEALQKEMGLFYQAINHGDEESFCERFRLAGEIRRQVPQKNKGFVSMLYEIVVQVQDKPGAIAGVVNLLAETNVNIKDIEILRVREGEAGTLRLAVEDEEAQEMAIRTLREHGYQVVPK
ncbi:MAG TPA: prephenate dehydrogenase [Bacillota bacterium]|nr:prephenate dehydrogenase [Bacillota bacterium]